MTLADLWEPDEVKPPRALEDVLWDLVDNAEGWDYSLLNHAAVLLENAGHAPCAQRLRDLNTEAKALYLDRYANPKQRKPGGFGKYSPGTSIAAAYAHPGRKASQRVKLGWAFYYASYGLTDEEAAAKTGLPPQSCYWKRCGELREMGYLTDTGETRTNGISGEARKVWAMSEAAKAAWQAHFPDEQ